MSLKDSVLDKLNEQLWLENHASFYYLKLSIEFSNKGFNGISKFFLDQSNEERNHMLKIIDYMLERGSKPTLPSMNYTENKDESFSVLKYFKDSLFNEKQVSDSIFSVLTVAREEKDYFTESLMNEFLIEQREEESKFQDIIDKLIIIGDSDKLYDLDNELKG
jgi:ferritin